MIRTLAPLILGFQIIACTVEVRSPSPSTNDGSASDAQSDIGSEDIVSEAKITSLSYQRETHSLVLELNYSGCGKAEHRLVFGACAESYPAQCSVTLWREKDYNASCNQPIREEFVHKLDDGFDAAYVRIQNQAKESKTVLVDKTGDVGKNVSPPGSQEPGTQETEQSSATIRELTYDKDKHALVMTLEYGGCSEAKHDLIFSDICLDSFPTQCSAVLVYEKGYDTSCKKLNKETFTYPLAENVDTTVLTINAKASNQRILVDRTGKVQVDADP